MKTLAVEDCPLSLIEVAETDEPLVLTKRGEPVAAVFPCTKDDVDSLKLSSHPHFLRLLEKSIQRADAEGWVPLAEARRQAGT